MIVGLGPAGRSTVFCRLLIGVSPILSLGGMATTAQAAPPAAQVPATRPATSPAEEERFQRGESLSRFLADLVEQAGQADGAWPEQLPVTRPAGSQKASAVPQLVYLQPGNPAAGMTGATREHLLG